MVAESAEHTYRLLETQAIDVVLLDLKLPGAGGLEALHKIKQRRPDAEVVVVTGYATVQSAVQAMKNGAYDYVTKPFTCLLYTSLAEAAVFFTIAAVFCHLALQAAVFPWGSSGHERTVARRARTAKVPLVIRRAADLVAKWLSSFPARHSSSGREKLSRGKWESTNFSNLQSDVCHRLPAK